MSRSGEHAHRQHHRRGLSVGLGDELELEWNAALIPSVALVAGALIYKLELLKAVFLTLGPGKQREPGDSEREEKQGKQEGNPEGIVPAPLVPKAQTELS